MAKYSQANRPLRLDTPLGTDALLLEKLSGSEAISEPFRFHLELLAEAAVDFNALMGQKATVTLALDNGAQRFVHGIIQSLTMGKRVAGPNGKMTFIRYRAELVPELWLLTRRVQSRIFQHKSVRDILHQVLRDEWQLDIDIRFQGAYHARNFCVQYRESDFAFVSRLMEEEGIGYFFQHEEKRHVLVLADHAVKYVDLPQLKSVVYDETEASARREPRVRDWEKRQELRACKVTVRDYCFQMPANDLTGTAEITPTMSIAIGKANHRLGHQRVHGDAKLLEVYDYPGSFAQWHDGVPSGGGKDLQQEELQKIIADKDRIARLRLDEEAAQALRIRGGSDCGHFVPGFKFSLEQHFDSESAGNAANVYLLTRLEQTASLEGAYTGPPDRARFSYDNRFECLPAALTFRPERVTPKPRIDGTQTAVVVAPKGAPVFLDQFGRVKVKFRWDRGDSSGADCSCWVRVSQVWAGKRWGAFFWPRVDHEVVVSFEEGDPDRPLITGSVYNAANPPPIIPTETPASCGFKSCSLGGDPLKHFNSLVFHDERGVEHVQIHSETHELITSKGSKFVRTPGPALEFSGSLPLPTGSGGGGGWLDWAELGDVSKGAHSTLMQFFPGKSSYVCGENFASTLLGGRTTHILGGGDVKVVVDLESLIENVVVGAVPLLTPLSLLALGIGGTTDFILGPKNQTIYWGPVVDVRRCPTYNYHLDKPNFEQAPYANVVSLLATLVALSTMTCDIMARVYAKVKEGPHHTKEVEAIEPWTALLGSFLTGRLHALLLLLETENAVVQSGHPEASHLLHMVVSWSKLKLWYLKQRQARDFAEDRFEEIEDLEEYLAEHCHDAAKAAHH